MKKEEVLNLIEEALEVDENSLTLEKNLDEIEEYDSMAKLSIIVMADDEFSKKLSGEQMREFKTIGDIVEFMES